MDFCQPIYFSQKLLLEGFPGWTDEVESKIQIVMQQFKPDFLIIYSQNSYSTADQVREMLDIMILNDDIFSIGVFGAKVVAYKTVVQDSTKWDDNDCSGRPGIYRGSMYFDYIQEARDDCFRRCGQMGEVLTHVGNVARKNGFQSILYSEYLKNGHMTQKEHNNFEDYCGICNAHSTALTRPCTILPNLNFGKAEFEIEWIKDDKLNVVSIPKYEYCSGCERAKETGEVNYGIAHIEGCPRRRAP